jgi:hypothetical protein
MIDDRSSPWVDLHQLVERVSLDRHSPQNILESESGRASPGDLLEVAGWRDGFDLGAQSFAGLEFTLRKPRLHDVASQL